MGKTELVTSLKCHALRGLFRRRPSSDHAHTLQRRTHGFSVQAATLPGEFSIWDFSGLREYCTVHETFLDCTNAIAVVVFSLRAPLQVQLSQVHFWLSVLRCSQRRAEGTGYAGSSGRRPHVVLVGSFADQERYPEFQMESSEAFVASQLSSKVDSSPTTNSGDAVMQMAVDVFGETFRFPEVVCVMDVRVPQSRGMKALRSLLGTLREQVLKVSPFSHTHKTTHRHVQTTCTNHTHTHTHTHITVPIVGSSNGVHALKSGCSVESRHASCDDVESLLSEDQRFYQPIGDRDPTEIYGYVSA